jgi:hypothetical protein
MVLRRDVVAPLPNPQTGESQFVDWRRAVILYIRSCSSQLETRLLHPQP